MEQEKHETVEHLGQINQGTGGSSGGSYGKSTNVDNGVLSDTVIVSIETASAGEDTGVLGVNIDRLQSSKRMVNHEEQEIGEPSDEGTSGNSRNAGDEVVIVINSKETVNVNGGAKSSGVNIQEMGSTGAVKNREMYNRESLDQVVVGINSQENVDTSEGNGQFEVKGRVLGLSRATVDQSKTKVPEEEKPSSVINIQHGGGGGGLGLKDDSEGEKVCRICHLSSDGLNDFAPSANDDSTTSMGLIQLGCGCKDELGIAHADCAEAWFKLKGNRICEICEETAKNITCVIDNGYLERRFIGNGNGVSASDDVGCWRGQSFCNLVMACLVIAFVLPWFFRVNMF